MTFVLFPLLTRSIVAHIQRTFGVAKEVALAFSHSFGLLIPLLLFTQLAVVVLYFFVPLMGRAGTQVPSDPIIAVISSILYTIPWLLPLALVHLDRNWKWTRLYGLIIAAIVLVIASRTFPYSSETPKRVFIQHTERFFYDRYDYTTNTEQQVAHDAGLWMNPLDHGRLEHLRPVALPENLFKEGSKTDEFAVAKYKECDGVYCSFPFILPIKEMCQPRSGNHTY